MVKRLKNAFRVGCACCLPYVRRPAAAHCRRAHAALQNPAVRNKGVRLIIYGSHGKRISILRPHFQDRTRLDTCSRQAGFLTSSGAGRVPPES